MNASILIFHDNGLIVNDPLRWFNGSEAHTYKKRVNINSYWKNIWHYFSTIFFNYIFQLYFSTIFSNYIFHLYFSTIFFNYIFQLYLQLYLQLYFSTIFFDYIFQLYFSTLFFNYIFQLYSWLDVLESY